MKKTVSCVLGGINHHYVPVTDTSMSNTNPLPALHTRRLGQLESKPGDYTGRQVNKTCAKNHSKSLFAPLGKRVHKN